MRLPVMPLLTLVVSASCTFGQAPSIASGGVVNAASWSSPLAPGEMVAIFGTNLASGRFSASAPLPNTLGGTSVLIDGIEAPIAFVSPTQINVQAPSSLPAPSGQIDAVSVIVATASGVVSATAALTYGAPGFFTADASGCGQAAALNIRPDGTVSVNSPSNSARPGDYIALFGTGFGTATNQPPDGTTPSGASALKNGSAVIVDGQPASTLAYQGLAPGLTGVDQINFQLPASIRNGCAVPVAASQMIGSPSVTISVQNGGGQCVDPPIQSSGQVLLARADFSGEATVNDAFYGSFPTSPNPPPSVGETVIYAPEWMVAPAQSFSAVLSAVPIRLHECVVPGYSDLSAGVIQIQAPSGSVATFQPLPVPTGGVVYSGALPTGFLSPGTYTISGTPGSAVALNAKLNVGSPIQIQTPLAPGTVISSSQPLNLQWTGGTPGSLVRVALYVDNEYSYSYAHVEAGFLTIPPACVGSSLSAPLCSFGLPNLRTSQITVEVLPDPANATSVSIPGITAPVQLNWQYSYDFPSLNLGP